MRDKWVIDNSEICMVPRSANGRDYMLYVQHPYSYKTESTRHYPVLYLLDAYWDFTLLSGIYGHLLYDKLVPEFLIAGIGYQGIDIAYHPLRQLDFCDERPRFIDALEHELIPFVEREFRVDPSYRVIAGASTGASFAMSVLFTRPELFQGAIAIAPTDPACLEDEQLFAAQPNTHPLRLLVSCGTEDPSGAQALIAQLIDQLEQHQHALLDVEILPVEGALHAGAKPHGFSRGLAFTFAPRVA